MGRDGGQGRARRGVVADAVAGAVGGAAEGWEGERKCWRGHQEHDWPPSFSRRQAR